MKSCDKPTFVASSLSFLPPLLIYLNLFIFYILLMLVFLSHFLQIIPDWKLSIYLNGFHFFLFYFPCTWAGQFCSNYCVLQFSEFSPYLDDLAVINFHFHFLTFHFLQIGPYIDNLALCLLISTLPALIQLPRNCEKLMSGRKLD